MPNLHHITFSIGTRITDRTAEGRTEEERGKEHLHYEILVVAKTYDSANNALPVTDNVTYFPRCYGGTDLCFDSDWGWSKASLTMLPILNDIFREWQCIVEYLKYRVSLFPNRGFPGRDRPQHPLLHIDVLREGMDFRRATLRISGTTIMGILMVDGVLQFGVEDDRTWQELRNGRWEDL